MKTLKEDLVDFTKELLEKVDYPFDITNIEELAQKYIDNKPSELTKVIDLTNHINGI